MELHRKGVQYQADLVRRALWNVVRVVGGVAMVKSCKGIDDAKAGHSGGTSALSNAKPGLVDEGQIGAWSEESAAFARLQCRGCSTCRGIV